MVKWLVFAILSLHVLCKVRTQAKATSKAQILLLRMLPNTSAQLEYLNSLVKSKGDLKLQMWRHPDQLERHVDMWISNKSYSEFKSVCDSIKMQFEVITKHFHQEVKEQNVSMKNIERFEESYQHYKEIEGELKRLAHIYKNMTTLEVVGKSYEDRNIYSIKIHTGTKKKPVIFINCGTHAREWLAVSSCQFFLRKILFDYKYDPDIELMLKEFDVVMIPLLNPDGYIFSYENKRYRLWRKSRSPTSEYHCRGVDINRNFDYRWGGGGSSPDPCEEIYCGTKPFSEKESLVLARYLYKLRRYVVTFLDVHTYGQLWLSPWGFSEAFPQHYSKQTRAMKAIQAALIGQKGGGVRYKFGRSSTSLYQTSGDSLDWVYGRLGIVYSFAIELRPAFGTRRGFRYTTNAIRPTGRDLLVGVTALARYIFQEKNSRTT